MRLTGTTRVRESGSSLRGGETGGRRQRADNRAPDRSRNRPRWRAGSARRATSFARAFRAGAEDELAARRKTPPARRPSRLGSTGRQGKRGRARDRARVLLSQIVAVPRELKLATRSRPRESKAGDLLSLHTREPTRTVRRTLAGRPPGGRRPPPHAEDAARPRKPGRSARRQAARAQPCRRP
jgi:hypothetical protein